MQGTASKKELRGHPSNTFPSAVLPGVAISRQSGYFGKPVAGKNLWLVATMIVAIFGLRIGLFVAIFGIVSELGYLWLFLDLKLKWL